MGVQNFIPTMWAAAVQVELRKNLVYAGTVNRRFEADLISFGDTVKINEIGDIDITDYTRGGEVTWQQPDTAQQEILVDQQKYFAVLLDDVDDRQTKPKLMQEFAAKASYKMADTIDQHIAGMYTQAGNSVDDLTVTVGNVILNLSNMKLALDEANVPSQGRMFPIPPWYHQHLLNAATQSISATGVPKVFDDGRLVSGFVGNLYGFDFYLTNNVDNNETVWNLMAYTREALAHIQQINKVLYETPVSGYFSNGVRGLAVYGSKVTRPAAMVSCAATKG